MTNIQCYISNLVSLGALYGLVKHPRTFASLPRYAVELRRYRQLELAQVGHHSKLRLYPCLDDAHPSQAVNDFYFYQDCWAARQVFQERPPFLVDVGSTVLLVGILSQFAPCISVDIRPIEANLAGLSSKSGSVLQLPFADCEVPCLTTMCVLEHIGLGRYGDPLDPLGTEKAVAEIKRIIKPGGIVVYSVPVGPNMTEFNANRRYHLKEASELFFDWTIVDGCVLAPSPLPMVTQDQLANFKDPTACFCVRKPVVSSTDSTTG